MWGPEKVEQALFRWQKWRQAIISQWIDLQFEPSELPSEQLKAKAGQELQKLNFPSSLWLQLYWICCITSDYNLDYETSFESIAVPAWFSLPFDPSLSRYRIELGRRIYPPYVLAEGDIDFISGRSGGFGTVEIGLNGVIRKPPAREWHYYLDESDYRMFLPSGHEFYYELKKLRGRPKKFRKRGRQPDYSDRLAVRCAALKDISRMTYVEIAEKFELPVEKPYESWRSDTTRHLVNRGRKLKASVQTQL